MGGRGRAGGWEGRREEGKECPPNSDPFTVYGGRAGGLSQLVHSALEGDRRHCR